MTLGEIIADARESKNFSQRQLALYSGVSNTEISRIEKNQRKNPSPKIIKKLCDCLDLDYEYMLEVAGYLIPEEPLDNYVDNSSLLTDEEKKFIEETLLESWEKSAPASVKNKVSTVTDIGNILYGKSNPNPYNLSTEELELFETIKSNPNISILFHDLKNADSAEIKELLRSWDFIKEQFSRLKDHTKEK